MNVFFEGKKEKKELIECLEAARRLGDLALRASSPLSDSKREAEDVICG